MTYRDNLGHSLRYSVGNLLALNYRELKFLC